MVEQKLIADFEHETDPIDLFDRWLKTAEQHEINDPNAMALASVDQDGVPDVRMVLLNGREGDDFLFYTNMNSTKGQQLLAHPQAALCFHWKSLRAQVRVRGNVERVSDALADAYFETRHPQSRLGAHASDQSQPLDNRKVLMDKVARIQDKYREQNIPRPQHWSGFRLKPHTLEFWRDGDYRLHDRIVFSRQEQQEWATQRLYP